MSNSGNPAVSEPQSTAGSAIDVRAEPLFIDTGAFFAYYNERDEHHERARMVFHAIRTDERAYEPLYVSRSVLAELATLLLYKIDHATASRAISDIHTAESFNVVRADDAAFADARTEFDRYDEQEITLVDHLTAVLANERGVDRVFAFDSDFRTLGFTVIPDDTGDV